MLGKVQVLVPPIAKRLGLYLIPKKTGLVFLTLHHLDESNLEWLSDVLDWLQYSCDVLDPSAIEKHSESAQSTDRSKVILTFDDGFHCHKQVAEECLDRRGIKALFFLPTDFIGLTGRDALEFTKKSFFPHSSNRDLTFDSYDAMTWDDVRFLVDKGHTIGGHTATHGQLSKAPAVALVPEIVGSADLIETLIGVKVKHFAYPFGSIEAICQSSYSVVADRFEWAYSNVRGGFYESPSQHFIFRQNLVPGCPIWLVKAIVEGRLDFRYWRHHSMARSLCRRA